MKTEETLDIELPYKFQAREYQKALFTAIRDGVKRACVVWHRRAGKDKTLINLLAVEAHKRIGTYYYFFPTFNQGRKILWEGKDREGLAFIDHFPADLISRKNEGNMRIEFKYGSAIQVVGTDNYDSIRGTNPIGCVFSEYAFQNPGAWNVVRPILAENGGWAVFNSTPNGKNHFYRMYTMACGNSNWFTQRLTVDDTNCIGKGIIDEELASGMTEEMIQQEYYCSFEVGMLGAYYAKEMQQAYESGRITEVPFFMDIPIDIYFDLGIDDKTAMWFGQPDNLFYNFINYYENNNKSFEHYAWLIEDYVDRMGGKLGHIYLPHDAKKRDWVTGKSALQAFQERFGQNKVVHIEIGSLESGIQAVRARLPLCRFNQDTCSVGIDALENYSRKYDDVLKVFSKQPDHNCYSHGADAFRAFAVSFQGHQHRTIGRGEDKVEDEKYNKAHKAVISTDYDSDL